MFEGLFGSHGWEARGATASTTMTITIRASMKSWASRGSGQVQFGGKDGRAVILPAGTGHQRIKASNNFLVVGAFPAPGGYDDASRGRTAKGLCPQSIGFHVHAKILSMPRTVL